MSIERRWTGPASRRPVKRLVAIIFVVALGFCAVCGHVLLEARRAAWEHAADVGSSLVATIGSDIARNIESYDLSLRGVIENLANPEITHVSVDLRQLILFDRSANAKHLETISLTDQNGIVRLDSRTPFPKPVSRAERDYFQFHKNNKVHQLHVSEPIVARDTGHRIIVVSRRLSNEDGSFAGVVAGSIRLAYFENLFRNASLGPQGNITLSRADGKLLFRWPFDSSMLGRDLSGGELYKRLADAPSGKFETHALTDGVHRLVVYSKIGDLPLVIGVGQSTSDIYAQWRDYALIIGMMMLVLCATSMALTIYLGREMKSRSAAESRLEILATTDSLTGLANRRTLGEMIGREWLRATADQTALALVMCDTDFFKTYNDRYGHQAGDRLLQAIGVAMDQSIRRGVDIAARYGGDEFAVLLPGLAADAAANVADLARRRVAEICDEWDIPRSRLSFGVASFVPQPGEGEGALMAAADKALYRAKERGRDGIEIAPKQRPPRSGFVAEHAAA